MERDEEESYELMRVCRLNRIKIKNPAEWDKAKYDNFVEDEFILSDKGDAARRLRTKRNLTGGASTHGESIRQGGAAAAMSVGAATGAGEEASSNSSQTILTIHEEVTIYEYAPKKFQDLRDMDRIEKSIIKHSLSAKRNRDQAFMAGESQGKSGSFFFFSHDRKFIIKTMNEDELGIFMKALPDYFKHMKENPGSLIARIYGVFKVKMEDIVPVNLLLMANTIRCESSKCIQNVFDLKGSMINRDVKMTSKIKNTSTLKD